MNATNEIIIVDYARLFTCVNDVWTCVHVVCVLNNYEKRTPIITVDKINFTIQLIIQLIFNWCVHSMCVIWK